MSDIDTLRAELREAFGRDPNDSEMRLNALKRQLARYFEAREPTADASSPGARP